MVNFIILDHQKFQTVHDNASFLHLNPLGNYFTGKPNFDAFCGTNIYSGIIFFNISYPNHRIFVQFGTWYLVPLLYGFLSVHALIMVPQKFQYQSKSGSMSKDRPLKSRTLKLISYHTFVQINCPHDITTSQFPSRWNWVNRNLR